MSETTDDLDWFDEDQWETIRRCASCGQKVYWASFGALCNEKDDNLHDCRLKTQRVVESITRKFLRRHP